MVLVVSLKVLYGAELRKADGRMGTYLVLIKLGSRLMTGYELLKNGVEGRMLNNYEYSLTAMLDV